MPIPPTALAARPRLLNLLLASLLAATAFAGAVRAQFDFGGERRAEAPGAVEHVTVSLKASKAAANPGDQLVLAIVLDHAPTFHTWPNKPVIPAALGEDFPAIPTTAALVKQPAGVSHVGPVQWPEPHAVRVDYGTGPIDLISFEGETVAYLPVILSPDAPAGVITFEVEVGYQACDDRVCYQPQTRLVKATVEVVPLGSPVPAPVDEPLFAEFDPTIFARLLAGEVVAEEARSEFDFLGLRFDLASNAYLLILGLAFVAGFLLNLTPCVLPVIPIKIISLQKQAANPATLAVNGFVYCLGIVATFAALGLLIFGVLSAGGRQEWGQIYSYPWFTIPLAVIVGVFGLGMMGLFTIRLPAAVYGVNPSLDSVHGNFLFGVLTAILSTPCTGPLLGAALAWAATQPAWLAMATITVMGVGMAAPYGALIAFPGLLDRMPKAGPGGELLKQVLGILLLAVAAYMGSLITIELWPWWIVGGFVALACVWLAVGSWRLLRSGRAKRVNTVLGALGVVLALWGTRIMTDPGPIPWVAYSPGALAEAREAGKTVVIDFTAKWCVNCHVLEKSVLAQPPVVGLLNSRDVVPMKVDLTSEDNVEGWSKQKELSGGGGIPLTAVYVPGRDEPVLFRSFYPGSALERVILDGRAAPGDGAGVGAGAAAP